MGRGALTALDLPREVLTEPLVTKGLSAFRRPDEDGEGYDWALPTQGSDWERIARTSFAGRTETNRLYDEMTQDLPVWQRTALEVGTDPALYVSGGASLLGKGLGTAAKAATGSARAGRAAGTGARLAGEAFEGVPGLAPKVGLTAGAAAGAEAAERFDIPFLPEEAEALLLGVAAGGVGIKAGMSSEKALRKAFGIADDGEVPSVLGDVFKRAAPDTPEPSTPSSTPSGTVLPEPSTPSGTVLPEPSTPSVEAPALNKAEAAVDPADVLDDVKDVSPPRTEKVEIDGDEITLDVEPPPTPEDIVARHTQMLKEEREIELEAHQKTVSELDEELASLRSELKTLRASPNKNAKRVLKLEARLAKLKREAKVRRRQLRETKKLVVSERTRVRREGWEATKTKGEKVKGRYQDILARSKERARERRAASESKIKGRHKEVLARSNERWRGRMKAKEEKIKKGFAERAAAKKVREWVKFQTKQWERIDDMSEQVPEWVRWEDNPEIFDRIDSAIQRMYTDENTPRNKKKIEKFVDEALRDFERHGVRMPPTPPDKLPSYVNVEQVDYEPIFTYAGLNDALSAQQAKRDGATPRRIPAEAASLILRAIRPKVSRADMDFIRDLGKVIDETRYDGAQWMSQARMTLFSDLRQADGMYDPTTQRLEGTESQFTDLLEQTTVAARNEWKDLSDQQKSLAQEAYRRKAGIDATRYEFGVRSRLDPEIKGVYMGRLRASAGERVRTGGKSLGADLEGKRVFASVGEMEQKKIPVMDPLQAYEMRGMALVNEALDEWAMDKIEGRFALSKKMKEQGILSSHPGLADRGLRFTPEIQNHIDHALTQSKEGNFEAAVNQVVTLMRSANAMADDSAIFNQLMPAIHDAKGAKITAQANLVGLLAAFKGADGGRVASLYAGLERELRPHGWSVKKLAANRLALSGQTIDEVVVPSEAIEWMEKIRVGPVPVGKVPAAVVKASNTLFNVTLDAARLKLATTMLEDYVAQGLKGDALTQKMRETNAHISRATGTEPGVRWTPGKYLAFSWRYLTSGMMFLSKAAEGTAKIGRAPTEARLARNRMARMVLQTYTLVTLFNTLRGEETEWDPRKGGWLALRNVGGHDINVFGGAVRRPIQLMARLAAGTPYGEGEWLNDRVEEMITFGFSKGSPLVTKPIEVAGIDVFDTGLSDTFLGENPSALDHAKGLLPFAAQAALDEGPLAAGASGVGLTANETSPSYQRDQLRNQYARRMLGRKDDPLSPLLRSAKGFLGMPSDYESDQMTAQQRWAIEQQEDVQELREKAETTLIERGGRLGRATGARVAARKELDIAGDKFRYGEITAREYRDGYGEVMGALISSLKTINAGGRDNEVEGYYDLRDQATEGGITDYDKLHELEEAYKEEHPGIEERIDAYAGVLDEPIAHLYRQARKEAEEYYSIPAYRGLSLEEGNRLNEVIREAQAMVTAGTAYSRRHALAILYDTGDEEQRQAVTHARLGKNRRRNHERDAFREAHALFRIFFSEGKITSSSSEAELTAHMIKQEAETGVWE